MFNIYLTENASNWQLGFQIPASPIMEGIVNFHHDLFFFLTAICCFVFYLLARSAILFNSETLKNPIIVVHAPTLEIIWTLIPAIILLFVAIPSFSLLYSMDEIIEPLMTIKVIGHQWYWSYEFLDPNLVLHNPVQDSNTVVASFPGVGGKWNLMQDLIQDIDPLKNPKFYNVVINFDEADDVRHTSVIPMKDLNRITDILQDNALDEDQQNELNSYSIQELEDAVLWYRFAFKHDSAGVLNPNLSVEDIIPDYLSDENGDIKFYGVAGLKINDESVNDYGILSLTPELRKRLLFAYLNDFRDIVPQIAYPAWEPFKITCNFDSYLLADEFLDATSLRLLEVDNRLYLPVETNVRVLITAADVLHAWAVPALGVKLDACPGRLNQTSLYIKRPGIFYGQCSEICGVNHGFMPIALVGLDILGDGTQITANTGDAILPLFTLLLGKYYENTC